MDDHLPECPFPLEPSWTQCICPELRAAEQRVWDTAVVPRIGLDRYEQGYADCKRDAREAVAELKMANPRTANDWSAIAVNALLDSALAAVDALKAPTERSANPEP